MALGYLLPHGEDILPLINKMGITCIYVFNNTNCY